MPKPFVVSVLIAAFATSASAAGPTIDGRPTAFGLPYCLRGDKIVCEFVILKSSDLMGGGALQQVSAEEPLPAIGSVDFRRLPDDGLDGTASQYILVFYLQTPQDLPR